MSLVAPKIPEATLTRWLFAFLSPKSMNAQEIIDSLERDIERMRGIDPALLASMVARLDELRKMVK